VAAVPIEHCLESVRAARTTRLHDRSYWAGRRTVAISSKKPDHESRGSTTAASYDVTDKELRELTSIAVRVRFAHVFDDCLEPLALLDEMAALAKDVSPAFQSTSLSSMGAVAVGPCELRGSAWQRSTAARLG
jgi:hypothetical protein